MSSNSQPDEKPTSRKYHRSRIKAVSKVIALTLCIYLLIAYLLLPLDWIQYVRRHPAIDEVPGITETTTGIPGDPINVGLVGTEVDLHTSLHAANWYPADPITLESSLRIAADTVLKRSYHDAPVSSLFLWGRKQDLAFEQPVGNDPRRRHHVRFWRSEKLDEYGKPMWFGAVTFDTRVGLSHTTGEITHHIDPDIDSERNKLLEDLRQALQLKASYWIDGFHHQRDGKNGGGDPYFTDGRLGVGVLNSAVEKSTSASR